MVAYLALFVALGGSAYAVTRIDSGDVANNSLKSKDLKDGKAVAGRDLRQDTLTGEQIREHRLDASGFSAFASGAGGCDPTSTVTPCGYAQISTPTQSKILAVVNGGFSSPDSAVKAVCELTIGGQPVGGVSVGQDTVTHSDGVTADGFSLSGVSPTVPAGSHHVGLGCREVGGEARVSDVNISAIAIGSD